MTDLVDKRLSTDDLTVRFGDATIEIPRDRVYTYDNEQGVLGKVGTMLDDGTVYLSSTHTKLFFRTTNPELNLFNPEDFTLFVDEKKGKVKSALLTSTDRLAESLRNIFATIPSDGSHASQSYSAYNALLNEFRNISVNLPLSIETVLEKQRNGNLPPNFITEARILD